jgi:hypothetical protein
MSWRGLERNSCSSRPTKSIDVSTVKRSQTAPTSAPLSKTEFNGVGGLRTHTSASSASSINGLDAHFPAMGLTRQESRTRQAKEIADGVELKPRSRLPQTG